MPALRALGRDEERESVEIVEGVVRAARGSLALSAARIRCTKSGWLAVASGRPRWTRKSAEILNFQSLAKLPGSQRHSAEVEVERETRLELATPTLARLCSTN